MPGQDSSYRLLFSHQEVVRDLLTGFVHGSWMATVELDSIERVSGSYVTDDLCNREDDIIWRVRCGDRWLYVYLLIEFQSTVDPMMGVRIMGYEALLYQDLVEAKMGPTRGPLPIVLPIVLYNGGRRWTAPRDVADLIMPAPQGLEAYRPHLRYLLLEERRFTDEELIPLKNLVAAIFLLEKSRTREEFIRVVDTLVGWLIEPEQVDVERAFTVWINRVLWRRRYPGIRVPELKNFQEVRTVLAERVQEWAAPWLEEGLEKGRQEGEAAALLRLLEDRFGPIDEIVRGRVSSADTETLMRWIGRVLTASGPDDALA